MVQTDTGLAWCVDSVSIHVPAVKGAMGLSLHIRSALGYKERSSSTQESRYTGPEAPAYSKPYWNEAM